ncbi:Auxin-binding protein ABP19a [Bienertia sinuspersici]
MDFPKLFLIFSLLTPFSSATFNVVDFCVANLDYPAGPAGYPCKDPAGLTAEDFIYYDVSFPGLNGLGLSLSRLDFGVNGVVVLHSHRVSEVILVAEGTIIAGFIGSDNTAYFKTLKSGTANGGFQSLPNSLGQNDIPTEVLQKASLLDASQVRKLKEMFGGTN